MSPDRGRLGARALSSKAIAKSKAIKAPKPALAPDDLLHPTAATLRDSRRRALDLDPDHVSLYLLEGDGHVSTDYGDGKKTFRHLDR